VFGERPAVNAGVGVDEGQILALLGGHLIHLSIRLGLQSTGGSCDVKLRGFHSNTSAVCGRSSSTESSPKTAPFVIISPISTPSFTTTTAEAETGKGTGALDRRPQLAAALAKARAAKCPVIVSKLDRLSRDHPAHPQKLRLAPNLDLDRCQLAALVAAARADGDHLAKLRLFLGVKSLVG
jgi:hypothetical protein